MHCLDARRGANIKDFHARAYLKGLDRPCGRRALNDEPTFGEAGQIGDSASMGNDEHAGQVGDRLEGGRYILAATPAYAKGGRFVVRPADVLGDVPAESLNPSLHEPARMPLSQGQVARRVLVGRGEERPVEADTTSCRAGQNETRVTRHRFILFGYDDHSQEGSEDGIGESGGLLSRQGAGEADGFMNRGGRWNTLKVKNLVESKAENVQDRGLDMTTAPAAGAFEKMVQRDPLPDDAIGQLGGQSAVSGRQLTAIQRLVESLPGPCALFPHLGKDFNGGGPGGRRQVEWMRTIALHGMRVEELAGASALASSSTRVQAWPFNIERGSLKQKAASATTRVKYVSQKRECPLAEEHGIEFAK